MPSRKVGSVHTSPGRMNMPTFFLKSGCHCKRILINKQIISLKEKTNLGDIIGMCWVSRKDYVIADFWNIQEIQLNSDAPLAKWDSAKWSEWKSLSHIGLYETQWTIQSMEFSRPEHWSRYPLPSPGGLPHPGITPRSPTLQTNSLPAQPPGKARETPGKRGHFGKRN